MKTTHVLLTAVLMAFSHLHSGAEASAQVTPLPDLFEATKRHHPLLRSQRANLRGTQENITEARAAYRPQVFGDASVRTSRRDATLQGGGDFEQNLSPRSVSIRATQTIYNGGRRYLQTYGATISVQSARARYEASVGGVLTEVQQDYISLAEVQARIGLLQTNVDILKELNLATETRFAFGDSSKIDTAQVLSRLASSEASLAAAKSERNILQARLKQATGITVLEAELPAKQLDVFELNYELVQQEVRRHSPVLEASKLDERSAAVLLKSESRSHLPTIQLNAAAVASTNNSPTIDTDNQLNIGVRLTVPIYSGGTQNAQRRRAAASVQAARLNYQNDIRLTDQQTLQLWETLRGTRIISAAQKASLDAAEEALKGTRAAQATGLSTTLDVLDAMERKLSAELSLSQSLHDERNNELILARLMGRPYITAPTPRPTNDQIGVNPGLPTTLPVETYPEDEPIRLDPQQ